MSKRFLKEFRQFPAAITGWSRRRPGFSGHSAGVRVTCPVSGFTTVRRFLTGLIPLLSGLLFFAVPGGWNACLAQGRSDLWIVSGQSNACGRGLLPGPAGIPAVRMFDPSMDVFVVAEDPLPGMNTEGVGPWVAAAQHVAAAGPAVDVVGFAMGAQPISFWKAGAPGDEGLVPPIERAGKGAGIFIWYQGESDTASSDLVRAYRGELARLVARVRKAADNPEMTAVIVQLGPNTRTRPKDFQSDYAGVREAQRQFVISDGNALLVPALGKALKDGVHLSTAGYEELGGEIARAILRNRYGRTGVDWPGPILDAAVVDESGQRLVVHFAEVRKLDGVTPDDFAVSDAAGETVCRSARAGSTTVELFFDRRITLPAFVTYGHGNGPRATLVDEAGNHAPAVRMQVSAGPVPSDEVTSSPSGAGKSLDMDVTGQDAAEEEVVLNPDLPNVLLIGDSISWGYFPYVQEALEGKANVVHAPGNNQGTTWGRRWLGRWLGTTRWDLIHFNWGLHDLKHVREVEGKLENSSDPTDPPQADINQYEINLRLLVRQLLKTGARLIFATTTPVPEGVTGVVRVPQDVIDYNRVALRIAEKNGIEVNDLYSLIRPDLEAVQKPRNVHFEEAGSRILARQVADRILANLGSGR